VTETINKTMGPFEWFLPLTLAVLRGGSFFFGEVAQDTFRPFTVVLGRVWGQVQISSELAAILNATTPLFTVVLAHLRTADQKMTAGRVAGMIAGLAGVAAMIGLEALEGLMLRARRMVAKNAAS
jgi:hypothetical protein